jgi:hypothetical protein
MEKGVESFPFPCALALALLVLGVLANNTHYAAAVNDLALVAYLLY